VVAQAGVAVAAEEEVAAVAEAGVAVAAEEEVAAVAEAGVAVAARRRRSRPRRCRATG
jgi:hypothetical protein